MNCLLLKVGLIAPTIIKLVPHFPLFYFLFVPPSKHITDRKKKNNSKGIQHFFSFLQADTPSAEKHSIFRVSGGMFHDLVKKPRNILSLTHCPQSQI